MQIRTVGELHDTINAQAKEIERLKSKLLKESARLYSSRREFKKYRAKHKANYPKSRTDKLRTHLIDNDMMAATEGDGRLLAEMFFLSHSVVMNNWHEIIKKGAIA